MQRSLEMLVERANAKSRENGGGELLRTRLEVVESVTLDAPVCRDPDDDVVLGTAISGRCEAIVTGDRDLLDLVTHGDIAIVSPRGFWSFESQRSRG